MTFIHKRCVCARVCVYRSRHPKTHLVTPGERDNRKSKESYVMEERRDEIKEQKRVEYPDV